MTIPIIWAPEYATKVLDAACGNGDLTNAIFSIMQGADVNAITDTGDSPLQLALKANHSCSEPDSIQAEEDRFAIFRLLICSGGNIRMRDNRGCNLAHLIMENIVSVDRALSYLHELSKEYTKRAHRRGLYDAHLRGIVFLRNLLTSKDHDGRCANQVFEDLIRRTDEDMIRLAHVRVIGALADQIRTNGDMQERIKERREKIRQVIRRKRSVAERMEILRERDTHKSLGRNSRRGL